MSWYSIEMHTCHGSALNPGARREQLCRAAARMEPAGSTKARYSSLKRLWASLWSQSSSQIARASPDGSPTQHPGSRNGSSRQQSAAQKQQPTHLIVMANGLFGGPSNWSKIMAQLRMKVSSQVLLHASNVNQRTATYDGIDVCGQRLADEIASIIRAHPSLERISVIGHSMGGLLLRYAIGVLYEPASKRIGGLQPCHFISMATPHLGCETDGVSQVPFIGAFSGFQPSRKLLDLISVPVAGLLFRRTGRQFFLADKDGAGGLPLLVQLTQDDQLNGRYYWSALSSFASRTAYANTAKDHLVGWANSSLRFMHQLPSLPPTAASAKGVVREDSLEAAFDIRIQPQPGPQSASDLSDLPVASLTLPTSPSQAAVGLSPSDAADLSPASPQTQAARTAHNLAMGPKGLMVEHMLERLQSLAWRRIDVSFKGAVMPLAHNLIQVTRSWDFEGLSVAAHLADQVVALEAVYFGGKGRGGPRVGEASAGSQASQESPSLV